VQQDEEATSEEDEEGFKRPKAYDTPVAFGPPLQVRWGGKTREYHDGLGLCSPLRWHPDRRFFHSTISKALYNLVESYVNKWFPDNQKAAIAFSLKKFPAQPFPESELADLRQSWFALLEDPAKAAILSPGQPFFLEAASQTLEAMGDPDYRILTKAKHSYDTGVPLGCGPKGMPRTPAVFRRKTHWRKLDDSETDHDMQNYKTAKEATDSLLASFKEEEEMGMMYRIPIEQAKERWREGELRIAALGAIQKPDGSYRVLHDATHGVMVNGEIRIRDLVDSPRAGEAACVQRICKDKAYSVYFCLAADIKKAHRRYKHRPEDHGKLACRLEDDLSTVWINAVGTFGTSSAAVWWTRLIALMGRIVGRMFAQAWVFHLMMADDLLAIAGGPGMWKHLLMTIVAYIMLGSPLFVGEVSRRL
jgi:hypothetical protein